MSTLGERIREVRGNLSQAEVAERLGIHKNTVLKWEKDENSPDFKALQKLILEYELSPEWLMLGNGAKHAPQWEDLTPRTVPMITFQKLDDEFHKHIAVHKEKLKELSALRAMMDKAAHEVMTLNAENREHRKIEKEYKEYLDAAADNHGMTVEKYKEFLATATANQISVEEYKEYLDAAAAQVCEQLAKDPAMGIPLDPDVAEHMGAFEDHAVDPDDLLGVVEEEDK